MQPPVDWVPPILMLVGGLVIGIVVAMIVARKSKGGSLESTESDRGEEFSELQLEIRDLEAKKEDLLLQLREMEDTAAKREPEQLAVERYAVELETAEVLRDIDRLTGTVKAPVGKKPSGAQQAAEVVETEETAPPSGMKGFVWGVASAAAIGALVIFVSNSASDRAEGGSVTGGPQMSGQPSAPAPDAALQQAIAAVNANPADIDARVGLAYEYLLREDFMNTFEQTQAVLQQNPDEPRALTYQSLVRLAMGQDKLAGEMLERAVEIDPNSIEARVYLALTYSQAGRFDDALAQIDEAKTRNPGQAARLDEIVAEIEMRKAGGGPPISPPSDEDPHASLLPPPPTGDEAPQAAAPQVAGPGSVTGTILLAPGVTVQPGAPIFVIVRDADAAGGPPTAVSRLVAGVFPMSFSVSAANSMMGDALPDMMHIEVRVELDGNAMTRDEGAPAGEADGVASGTSGLTITLK